MTQFTDTTFNEERALFRQNGALVDGCVFRTGESPLKECLDLTVTGCELIWKYPLWYDRRVTVANTHWAATARAGVWYTEDITVADSVIDAPKNFRRCRGVTLENVTFTDALETLWSCRDVTLKNVTVQGDYFAMNCDGLTVDGLTLGGGYCFDGVKNAVIRNSRLDTKDAFWNSENVTVYDSYIRGEYLGWNAKNLTLVNCEVESLQGFCYIEGLKLVDCRLVNTQLAFEYSDVDATLAGPVGSVFNPRAGVIRAPRIDSLILDPAQIDPAATVIDCPDIGERRTSPDWEAQMV